jgi:hypothetical protein
MRSYPPSTGDLSRRSLLKSAASMLPAVAGVSASAQSSRRMLAYISTYSSPQGPEGSKGNGTGINCYEADVPGS